MPTGPADPTPRGLFVSGDVTQFDLLFGNAIGLAKRLGKAALTCARCDSAETTMP